MRKGSVTLLNILNPSHENDQKSEGMAENNKKIEESGKKNKPKYRCSICGLGFARNTSLKSHLLIHSVLKPFVCNVCNMQFRRQQDLKRHSKLHTGEKPHRCLKCNRRFARLDALNRHLKSETVHSSKQTLNVSKQIVIKNTKISNSAKKIDGEALRQSVKQGVQSPQNVFDRKREQTIKNVEPLKFRRFSLDHGDANNAESCHILGATVSEVSGLTNNVFMNDKRIDQSELEKNPSLIKDIKCSVFRTKKYDVPINITDQSNKVGNAWDYHNNKGRPFPYSLSPPAGYFYNYNHNDKSLGALNYFKDTSMKRPGAELINTADKCQNRPVGIREHAEYGHRRDLHIDRRHSTTSLLNTERRVIQNVSTSNARYTKFSGSKEVENLEFKLLLNNIFPKLQYITTHVDRLEKMVERLVRNSEKNIQ
ncbi:Transcriptional regulator prz1 [Zancudomyces culisetae]|uniref:Transcriptional regulator prz1 n=1 Tax=Zancudomyces culisetae TaxID=1213189 RepID=A0A1R1PFW5_ZANCU|nr:Transcriptional regulator prz1 [Zancudomyces culisetae]|eukprot:OMH79752.1 Transcriptional regulator prz1 [Zancudomyces culisetae]